MPSPDWRQLAQRQLADYDARDPGRMFEEAPAIKSPGEAYLLQIEVAKLRILRGERLAGFKIGCVSDVVRRQLGMDRPLFGHVFCDEIRISGAELDPAAFANLAIEGEFAVRLARDIPDSDWLRSHMGGALAAFFPVIELHNYVLRGRQPALELIASNGLHAGIVLPSQETKIDDPDQLSAETISVFQNGKTIGETTGNAVPGGPLGTLCPIIDQLGLFGIRLKKDQLVLTGSPLPLYPVKPGDSIDVVSGSHGRVNAKILAHHGSSDRSDDRPIRRSR